jgi:hypothetical protein
VRAWSCGKVLLTSKCIFTTFLPKKFLFDVEGCRESPKSSKYSKRNHSLLQRIVRSKESQIKSYKLQSILVEEGEEHANAERVQGTRKPYDPAPAGN